MIQNFEYLIVFTSAPGVLSEQNDRYRIQPWKVNGIKAYKNDLQGMCINDPLQNISVKITFYFNILKQSILDFFWELPSYIIDPYILYVCHLLSSDLL